MSEEKKTSPADPSLPAFVKAAPELIPLWDWWVKEGRTTLMMVVVAALCVAGFYGVRNWKHGRDAAASTALVTADTVEQLENAVASYGSTKAGSAIRTRLAKGYYDDGRYQDALDAYDEIIKNAGKNDAFVDIAKVGRAYALEGLAKYAEAQKAFNDYAKENGSSYLLLTAKLGALRCQALAGDKDGAAKGFDALKAAEPNVLVKNRIEYMADVVKRHDAKRAARSLFDVANDAATNVDLNKKPVLPSAPAAKPAAAPAPAAKPAAPAPAPAAKPAAPAPAPAAKPAAPAPAPAPAKK